MRLNWVLIILFSTALHLPISQQIGQKVQPGVFAPDKTERKAYLARLITEFVSWPDQHVENEGAFLVSVFNDEDFFRYLTYLYKDVEIKGMKPKVALVKELAEINDSHILFLTKKSSGSIDQILKLTNNKPILTIGDCKDFGNKGTIVNFIDVQDEVKFEINLNSYKNSELKIDSRLFDVAKIID